MRETVYNGIGYLSIFNINDGVILLIFKVLFFNYQ